MRLETIYSQGRPRRTHRLHVGFSLLHLTLDLEHEMQLSRSLRVPCVPPGAVGVDCWLIAGGSMIFAYDTGPHCGLNREIWMIYISEEKMGSKLYCVSCTWGQYSRRDYRARYLPTDTRNNNSTLLAMGFKGCKLSLEIRHEEIRLQRGDTAG